MSLRNDCLKALSEHYSILIEGQCSVTWRANGDRDTLRGGPFSRTEDAEADCIKTLIADLVRIADEHGSTFSE